MRANNFVGGMTTGLIVGTVASVLVTNMNGKMGRRIKQTANRAARTVGDIANSMQQ